MPILVHQNCTTSGLRRVPLHFTSASSLAPDTAITASRFQVSKRGGAYVSSTTSMVAIGNGAYFAQLTTGMTDTVGFLLVRAKTSKTAESQVVVNVVPWNPYLDTSDRMRVQVFGIQPNTITATTILAKAIHPSALATGAVHNTSMASGSIRQSTMASGSVRSNVMASGSLRANTFVNDALTSRTFGANSLTSRALGTGAITATSLSNAAVQKIADVVLRRNLGNSATSAYGQTASGRNLLQASRKHVNRVLLSASLVIFKENDTTAAFNQALTTATGLCSQVITDMNTV